MVRPTPWRKSAGRISRSCFSSKSCRTRQEDLQRVNQELQDTNRGVVALYAELDERADHLRRADELKSKFLSHMSHEFRTPLNSMLALSRLLLAHSDGPLTAEQETQVRFIRKAAENLTELVDDLLDLAKVEAGKIVVVPSPFTVASLFGALRGMLRPLLIGDAVALAFDDPQDVPPLDTDEGKVSQILRNFISNAIKFTEQGEVRVWATADRQADTVSFHVRDTGIGIDPERHRDHLPGVRAGRTSLQGRVKGTGLGLPLAKKLAELLGGRIAVESTPGTGSTFSVTVPRVFHVRRGGGCRTGPGGGARAHTAAAGGGRSRRCARDPASACRLDLSSAARALGRVTPGGSCRPYGPRRSCSTSC